ncbi:MAG: M50 family metallopeptidase, partial [Anaerolineales bacterium]|nr:M50 family metallopeptidase [Anaerolineales bacterium]
EQASFFIAVPVGVFFHELSHALAVWAFGGQVAEFGYRAFWGYVVPSGTFTPTQDWFISLAGTLGSLLFGLTVWLIFRQSRQPALRYFGLRAFRFQTFFSLIYYPAFTLLGFEGDWATIYNFSATPLWSGVTAVFHLILLFLFWQGDRRGWFEMVAHQDMAEQQVFERATAVNTYDEKTQLQYIAALRRGGAVNQAKTALRSLLAQNPNSGAAHLEMAAVQASGKRHISTSAIDHARKALSLGLPNNTSAAYAHQLLGSYALDVSHFDDAFNHFSQGIALLKTIPDAEQPAAQLAYLFRQRSLTYRRRGQETEALQDMQQALIQAQRTNSEQITDFYQKELAAFGPKNR